jgi:hypothetical protein
MKRTFLLTLGMIVSLTGLFADDGEGRVFHFRPMARFDVLGAADCLLGDEYSFKADNYLSGSLTLDFLFFRQPDFAMGPRLDLGLYSGQDCPSFTTFSLGYHLESKGVYFTVGFQTSIVSGNSLESDWWEEPETPSDTDCFLADYTWTSLWIEMGYILRLGRQTAGLVLEFGISCLPTSIYMSTYEYDDYDSEIDVLGPFFLETFRAFVGIGYTF